MKLSLECFANDKDLSGSTKRLAIVMCRAEILRMDQRVFASYILVYNPMLIRLITNKLCRDKFIEMCADLLERIRIPLEDALAKSSEFTKIFRFW